MIYITGGQNIRVKLNQVSGKRVKAWWYSPRDGRVYTVLNRKSNRPFSILDSKEERAFNPPEAVGIGHDWVLVLDDESKGYPIPGQRFNYRAIK
jgi:hypothetical protein